MEKVFKSKVSIGLVCLIVGSYLICIIPLFFRNFSWSSIIVIFICLLLCYGNIKVLFTCRYIISGTKLTVKFFVIVDEKYDITKIIRISPTHSIISAPATSLDRLCINMENGNSVIVSPKDKRNFINELISINPEINLNGFK